MLQILRGVLLVVQIVIVITSFSVVGLAHSQAVFASGPLFVALLSMPLLGERVGWRRWTAIIVGMLGVLVILKPSGNSFDSKLLIPIACAVLFAVYVIATRRVGRDDSTMTSFFYTGVAGAVAISLVGPFYWTPLASADWVWMLVLCIAGSCSHYFLIKAYEIARCGRGPAADLSAAGLRARAIGVTMFGETLSLNMVAGSIIVVSAGIFTVWRESVVARQEGQTEQTPPPLRS